MPAFSATLKPLPVAGFSITSSADMEVALEAAIALGMRGTITAKIDRTEQPEWKVEIVNPQGAAIAARIGDVYIWDNITLISMSQTEFDARYDVTP